MGSSVESEVGGDSLDSLGCPLPGQHAIPVANGATGHQADEYVGDLLSGHRLLRNSQPADIHLQDSVSWRFLLLLS